VTPPPATARPRAKPRAAPEVPAEVRRAAVRLARQLAVLYPSEKQAVAAVAAGFEVPARTVRSWLATDPVDDDAPVGPPALAPAAEPGRPDGKVSRKEQGERTRRAILDAATELYAEAGVRGTGLIAIGQRAGVSHATVLYHYGSSRELLLAVLDDRDHRFRAHITPAFAGGGLPALARLPEVARFNGAHPDLAKLFTVLQAENLEPHEEAHDYFLARRLEIRTQLMGLLAQAKAAGDVRPDVDEATKADEILAFTSGAQLQWALDPGRIDLVALYESYTRSLLADVACRR
jgi:AcrR family transcriptional regulator